MGKYCAYGLCKSDDRYKRRPEMQGVRFIPFPKPTTPIGLERAKKWIAACGRLGFGLEKIKRNTYVCSKHFVDAAGPTELNPDPIPATSTIKVVLKRSRVPCKRRNPNAKRQRNAEMSPPTTKTCNSEIVEVEVSPMDLLNVPQSENPEIITSDIESSRLIDTFPFNNAISSVDTNRRKDVVPVALHKVQQQGLNSEIITYDLPNVNPIGSFDSEGPRIINNQVIEEAKNTPMDLLNNSDSRRQTLEPPNQPENVQDQSRTTTNVTLIESLGEKVEDNLVSKASDESLQDQGITLLKLCNKIMHSSKRWFLQWSLSDGQSCLQLLYAEEMVELITVTILLQNGNFDVEIFVLGNRLSRNHVFWKEHSQPKSEQELLALLSVIETWNICSPRQYRRMSISNRSQRCQFFMSSSGTMCQFCCAPNKKNEVEGKSSTIIRQNIAGTGTGTKRHTTNDRYLTNAELVSKVKSLRRALDTAKQKARRLEKKYETEGGNLISPNNEDLKASDHRMESEENLIFVQQQIKASQKNDMHGMRWHPSVIKYCIELRQKSKREFECLRKSSLVCLPSERTLRRYEAGFQMDGSGPSGQMVDEEESSSNDIT